MSFNATSTRLFRSYARSLMRAKYAHAAMSRRRSTPSDACRLLLRLLMPRADAGSSYAPQHTPRERVTPMSAAIVYSCRYIRTLLFVHTGAPRQRAHAAASIDLYLCHACPRLEYTRLCRRHTYADDEQHKCRVEELLPRASLRHVYATRAQRASLAASAIYVCRARRGEAD